MLIKTLEGNTIETKKVQSYLVSDYANNFPHWGWLVAAVLFFWPAAFIWLYMGLTRQKVQVEFDYGSHSEDHWISLDEYKKFSKVFIENKRSHTKKHNKLHK